MALNKVIMVGRLTADPELRKTDSGLEVTRFSIAVSMGANKTSFFNIVAWRTTATFITRYFKKGDGICIDGHLEYRNYEKDGAIIKVYEIICGAAGFSEGRGSSDGGQVPSPGNNAPQREFSRATAQFEEIPNEEGLPF